MNMTIFLIGLIAAMVLVLAIFKFTLLKKQKEIRAKNPGYPKGHWLSQGMGIGIAIGAGIGVAMQNIGLGVGVGVALGAGIGSQLETKYKDEIRPRTDEEKALRKQAILFTAGVFVTGLLIYLAAYVISG